MREEMFILEEVEEDERSGLRGQTDFTQPLDLSSLDLHDCKVRQFLSNEPTLTTPGKQAGYPISEVFQGMMYVAG